MRAIVVAFFGEPHEAHHHPADIALFLSVPRAVLVGVLLVLGFWPRLILDVIDPATRVLIGVFS